MSRSWGLRASAVAIGVLTPLAGAELLLWFLPTYGGAAKMPVNEDQPIARYEPHREFTWSRDWNFSIVNTVQINNAGFVSDVDYHADAPGPLLAVVGDSFVEAFMVPYRHTCAGRLATILEPDARVYSFAMRNVPLGQYLAYARYARDAFRPQALVVVVVENDLRSRSFGPPGIHFLDLGTDRPVLQRTDFTPSLPYRLARRSALARYLSRNLWGAWWRLADLLQTGRFETMRTLGRYSPTGLADQSETSKQVIDAKRVIDAFLDLLPDYSGLGPESIAFVVDGMRPPLYDDEALDALSMSNVAEARRYFLANAARRGYETIDMQPRFRAHYRKHRRRFEWPQDLHWNALGHEQCFEAVRSSKLLSEVFPASLTANRRPPRSGRGAPASRDR